MKVLSLFGGIECGLVALKRLGIVPEEYYSSEIDPYAIKITTANHPEVVHIGSITDVKYRLGELKWIGGEAKTQIDLMIGGSPCQDLSIAKANGKGLNWEKSGLFFEYMRLLTEIRPRYFLLENVASMKKADRDEITRIIGVEPIMINSALVSAQNRKRLYWTNIPGVKLPEDRGILLKDILEDIPTDDERWKPIDEKFLTEEFYKKIDATIGQFRRGQYLRIHADQDKAPTLTQNMGTGGNNVPIIFWYTVLTEARSEEAKKIRTEMRKEKGVDFSPRRGKVLLPRMDEKSNCLTTWVTKEHMLCGITQKPRGKNSGGIAYEWEKSPTITGSFEDNSKLVAVQDYDFIWRKLTPIECERLQTLPDNYTACVSNSRRYKAIGNGWTVDSIAHIFSHLPWQKLSELPAEPTPE